MPDKVQYSRFATNQPLDQSLTPLQVGGMGLTDSMNALYQRYGSWGKRPGSALAYKWAANGPFPNAPVSGVRWYRAYPTPLTTTIVSVGGSLWSLADPGAGSPTHLFDFTAAPNGPISFTSARDPNAMGGTGSDVLIICGGQSNTGFATSYLTISTGSDNGPGTVGFSPGPTASITMQFTRGSGYTASPANSDLFQITYQILPTDNPTSIAEALVTLINQSFPVATNGPDPSGSAGAPYLNFAYVVEANNSFPTGSATIQFGALYGGSAGDNITYTVTYVPGAGGSQSMGGNNGSLSLYNFGQTATYPTPGTPNPFVSVAWTGGGGANFGPLKFDGVSIDGLSYMITQGFTQCESWHDHVWYCGAQTSPDTLFASDIDQPEGFVFMLQEGGYDIGVGDGDPQIQTMAPMGDGLYVYKTGSIYAVSGYDFQDQEYSFAVSQVVEGFGIPSPECLAVLENCHVFFSGKTFRRLAPGAQDPEHIGATIPELEGAIASGSMGRIRAVAGDFQVLSAMNGKIFNSGNPSPIVLPSLAMWAYDNNDVIVYDDQATQRLGKYCWQPWSGWDVGYWIPFGSGNNAAQTGVDSPLLLWIVPGEDSSGNALIYQFGLNAQWDQAEGQLEVPIPWMAQTGWNNLESAERVKRIDRVFLEITANEGASIVGKILPSETNLADTNMNQLAPLTFDPTTVGVGLEAFNTLVYALPQALAATAFCFRFTEDGTAGAQFELAAYGLDIINEVLTP